MAQITEKILEIKTKVEGAQSVNDLKEQIGELTRLMDTLDKESLEYHNTVNLLVDAEEELTNVMKVGKTQLSAQEGSYNALVNRMTALKKAHKAVTDEATRSRLSDEIGKINEELKEMDAKNGVYVRNVGNYENAVKKALKTPQQELKALRTQLAQLTEGTAEYNAVFARMAQLTHDVTEQQEQLKWSSADLGDILGNVAGVATSIAGGFSAFNALSGLIGGESEELDKAMVQAQRFIQLIQGLEQLEQLGDKIKGLWKGIKNFGNQTLASAASLSDFNKETNTAAGAAQSAAASISATATATNTGAEATSKATTELEKYAEMLALTGIEEDAYIKRLKSKKEAIEDEIYFLSEFKEKNWEDLDEKGQERFWKDWDEEHKLLQEVNAELDGTTNIMGELRSRMQGSTDEIKKNTVATELNHKGLKKWLATKILASKQNKLTVAELNAMTTAQLVNTAATVAWSSALKVLRTALISTGIGAIIVALGALLNLLGKGLGVLWNWISGANKAKEQTEALQTAFDALNESLEAQEKAWERQEMLMDAQGKSYEEIYEARKKNLQGQLAETQALLASQQAIAKDIGQRKLQKEKYDDFRETLEELTEKEKELKEAIDDLDYKNYIDDIKEKKKADEEAAAAAKKAADEAAAAYNKQKESAEKLYKDLIQLYKDERTKLDEKYKEEKALLEKFGKDTSLLTKKYEEDKTKIVLKEEEARKKLRDQYNKDFDASFRSGSLEDLENQLANATEKLEDFEDVNKTIIKDENGMHAKNWADNVKYLNETYGVSIQNMSHFELILKQVKNEFDDATKALNDYHTQLAREDTSKLEERLALERELMDFNNERALLEYDNSLTQMKWYGSFTNNYISQMYRRWEAEDSIFQKRKERLQEEIEQYKEQANKITNSEEAKAEALKKVADLEKQLALETADYTIVQNERKIEASDNYKAAIQDSLDGISSILSTVADAWETSIKAQVDAGKISEEEGERQMENMRDIQSAIALINSFSSAVSAYNSMASIPFVGPALGAAAAAAAIASGLAQVKAINAVKKGDKGGGDSTRYAEVTPTLPDYNPTAVTNVTGGQETESLANAMSSTPIWVSVKDIDSAQSKIQTRDKETSF